MECTSGSKGKHIMKLSMSNERLGGIGMMCFRRISLLFMSFVLSLSLCREGNKGTFFAYAENSTAPNRIVVFPVWAEEILLELVDTDCIVWVGHPYLKEAETYWPTMKETKEICGSIWQETDDSEILKRSPDLIICSDELSCDYDAIFPNLSKAEIPVVFMKQPETISEIIEAILTLGNITGQEQKATELCNWFQLEVEKLAALRSKIPENKRLTAVLNNEFQEEFQLLADMTGMINLLQDCGNYIEVSDALIAELNPDIVVELNVCFDANGIYLPEQGNAESPYSVISINLHPSQYIIQDCYSMMKAVYPFLFQE